MPRSRNVPSNAGSETHVQQGLCNDETVVSFLNRILTAKTVHDVVGVAPDAQDVKVELRETQLRLHSLTPKGMNDTWPENIRLAHKHVEIARYHFQNEEWCTIWKEERPVRKFLCKPCETVLQCDSPECVDRFYKLPIPLSFYKTGVEMPWKCPNCNGTNQFADPSVV